MFASYLSWSINLVTQNTKIKSPWHCNCLDSQIISVDQFVMLEFMQGAPNYINHGVCTNLVLFLFLLCDQYHSQIKSIKDKLSFFHMKIGPNDSNLQIHDGVVNLDSLIWYFA
jgi:hypothetical protein